MSGHRDPAGRDGYLRAGPTPFDRHRWVIPVVLLLAVIALAYLAVLVPDHSRSPVTPTAAPALLYEEVHATFCHPDTGVCYEDAVIYRYWGGR